MKTDKKNQTYYICRVGNAKARTASTGTPQTVVGLVIKHGPRTGEWLNFYVNETEKTLVSGGLVEKAFKTLGITRKGGVYELDGRYVEAVCEPNTYNGVTRERVTFVNPSKFVPDQTKMKDQLEEEPF